MASIINASTSGAGGVITTADASGVLQLQTAGTTAVTVDASQNVGIGTTSPVYKLDIQGNTSGQFWASIKNTNAGAGSIGGWFFGNDTYSDVGAVFAGSTGGGGFAGANGINIGSWKAAPLAMFTNNTERMRIDASGRWMLNATTPLNSTARGSIKFDGSAEQGLFIATSGATSGQCMGFNYNTSTNVGSINITASATSYTTSSDYRLKEDVAPMVNALDTVTALKPVTYKWKSDGSDGQGFIAHELQAVVPDCVTGEKDAVDVDGNPLYQGIDTSFLVATLTAAIQELKTIIDTQAERIAVLENK